MQQILQWCYRHRRILIIDTVCLLLSLILLIIAGRGPKYAYSQQEAGRWSVDHTPYHQVSAFWPSLGNIGREEISSIRSKIQKNLVEASLATSGDKGNLWTDAYMAQTKDSVTRVSDLGLRGKEDVNIHGVGGSFFLFHPLKLINGSFFTEDDVMDDRVVIDRETAWALFGDTNIAGQSIRISDKTFVIAGVYDRDDNRNALKATGGKSSLFMDYRAFHRLYENAAIISYEAVLPQPIPGFALNTLQDAVGGEDSEAALVDNTDRFKGKSLLVRFSDTAGLFMRQSAVIFPYWENEMRALEWEQYCLLMIRLLMLAVPVVSGIYGIVKLLGKYGGGLWHRFWNTLFERIRSSFQKRAVRSRSEFDEDEIER